MTAKILPMILLSVSFSFTGCMTSNPLPLNERPQHWGKVVHQQHNFYQISPTLFRSEQPDTDLAPVLREQQIDVIINLRSRHHDPERLKNAIDMQKIKFVHIPIHTWQIDREDLLAVMKTIKEAEQQQQKVLIHCYHGSDRTGASVAMYRIIFQHWSIEEAKREMKQGGYGFHPIWKNIDRLFSPENVKWIQQQLLNPSY
ncbi:MULTISPECIES: dual specificity protein phosphatase family protein [unclassified Acinetobacter]|uniref:dual specificity protein phosphatase family protein n=1 Tax=unclassified Acinetobacter TaxID=196816 RepID=UPI0015D3E528|nr:MULTISPECIES: dual specificity protein phosphatase family protein [unclassified Acinetobacter]UIJ76306.1 dual specificity protein phosphatase family protein [Acinetobacter sp. SH20PTE14]